MHTRRPARGGAGGDAGTGTQTAGTGGSSTTTSTGGSDLGGTTSGSAGGELVSSGGSTDAPSGGSGATPDGGSGGGGGLPGGGSGPLGGAGPGGTASGATAGAQTAGAPPASGGTGGVFTSGGTGGILASNGGTSTVGGTAAPSGGTPATGGIATSGATGGSDVVASGGMAAGGSTSGGNASAGGGMGGTLSTCPVLAGTRLMENLARGLVAVSTPSGVYLGWRLLGTDPPGIAFHVYRGETRLTLDPIVDSTNYLDPAGDVAASYTVRAVVDGLEQAPAVQTKPLAQDYLEIPLDQTNTQEANHVAVGDLDGDGEFDFVVRRANQDVDPGSSAWVRSIDTFKLEAYHRDGQLLWRVDLGPNIEQGVWYAPFTVFDLDGDGRAEVITKFAERLNEDLNQDGITDYRNATGRVDAGPEYLAVLDGSTGALRAKTDWIARGAVADWGDTYGNRVNRNLIGIAYLDGQRPSVVMFRGTYALMKAEAWNFRDGALARRWQWLQGGGGGYHGIRVGDIDGDGRDEIINGSIAIDDNGTTLWVHGEGHGDRLQMTDIDPARPGLEIFYVQEDPTLYTHAHHLRDARTGSLLWGSAGNEGDNGRGNCADLIPTLPGIECWSSSDAYLYGAAGTTTTPKPAYTNLSIWWDDDLLRELMDSTHIDKYGGANLLTASDCAPGSRYAPMGYGDLFGDWREEVIHWCGTSIRIYTTTTLTNLRQYTLMHDSDYRTSVAAESMGYMQSTQPGFYFGTGMTLPAPQPTVSVHCLGRE